MSLVYNETKTTQLASYFLQKSKGEMFVLKLMKLLYICDREAFRRLGRPITFDKYFSMDHGPVLSNTLSIMNGMVRDCGDWSSMIAPRNGNKISIVDESEIAFDDLSDVELAIADDVYKEFGHVPRFRLADITHGFPEWKDPDGSSIPIEYDEILSGLGYKQDQITAIIENLKSQQAVDDFFELA